MNNETPLLGLASTRELLVEVRTRLEHEGRAASGFTARYVQERVADLDQMLDLLGDGILDRRTMSSE